MAGPKISAKVVAADIRSGMSNAELMEKYGLSERGIESLFRKLIENRVVTEGEISGIGQASSRAVSPESREAPAEPGPAAGEPRIDSKSAEAVLEEVRKGSHYYDIMMRLHMGRDELGDMLDFLVRRGDLTAEEVEAKTGRQTKQCPHCNSRVLERTGLCPKCGKDPNSTTFRPGAIRPRGRSGDVADDSECAWEDYWDNKGRLGLAKAYFHTVIRCLTSPSKFFSELPIDYGYRPPLLFGTVTAALPATVALFLIRLLTGKDSLGMLMAESVAIFLTLLIVFGIGLFIGSLILHGTLTLLGGANSRFQATLCVASYSCVTGWCGVVPLIGPLVGNIWGIYLNVIGIRETHQTSTAKAIGAVLVPFCASLAVLTAVAVGHISSMSRPHVSSAKVTAPAGTFSGTEFRSDTGRFSVYAPALLNEKQVTVKTALGKADIFSFSVKENGIEYLVAYNDMETSYFPFSKYLQAFLGADDREKMLNKWRGTIAKQINGSVVSERGISLAGYPGREIVMEASAKLGDDVVVKGRAFLVEARLYQVLVVAQREEFDAPEVKDFFESFRVLAE